MLKDGYIKLYRSLLDWEWYDDSNTFRLFAHLLLTVNFYDEQWHGITVKRGQRVYSVSALSKELRLSTQAIRTAIKHLISTNEVTSRSTPQYSIITVNNYDKYQSITNDATNEQQTDNKRATNEQQQSKKARKQEERNTPPISPPQQSNSSIPPEISKAWQAYAEMRKKNRKPLTERAVELALKKLERMAPGNYARQSAILEQSVFRSWAGLFDLKDEDEPEPEPVEFIPPKPEDDAPFRRSLPDGASLADWLPPATEPQGGFEW